MVNDRSNCCNAMVYVSNGDEGTNCYICSRCKKPCDCKPKCEVCGKVMMKVFADPNDNRYTCPDCPKPKEAVCESCGNKHGHCTCSGYAKFRPQQPTLQDLVKELEDAINLIGLPVWTRKLLQRAKAEIERLQAEVKRLNEVHNGE